MEVHLTPDLEQQLNDVAAKAGRGAEAFFETCVIAEKNCLSILRDDR